MGRMFKSNFHTHTPFEIVESPFEELHLTKEEIGELRTFCAQGRIQSFSFFQLSKYIAMGFVVECTERVDNGLRQYYAVTPRCRRYLEYLKTEVRQNAKQNRRYWITTGIAVGALLKAYEEEIRKCILLLSRLLKQLLK